MTNSQSSGRSNLDRCPTCGAPRSEGVLGGLCPDCLIRHSIRPLGEPTVQDSAGPLVQSAGRPEDYELLGEIGRGGMGVVWRARHIRLNRLVALKTLRPGTRVDMRTLDRFRDEAAAAATLVHPNIVPLYEVGEWGGKPFFAMALLEGGTLADYRGKHPRPDFRRVVALVARLARAVHYAHQRGLIHGDLKPANVLLDDQGEPQLTDFGLARWVDGGNPRWIAGTPAYMAPEQVRGDVHITTAVDVYGLGALLYELLTGSPPYGNGDTEPLLRAIQESPVPSARALDPTIDLDLDAVLKRALAKAPQDRYASAAELAEDLNRWLDGELVRARSVGPVEQSLRWLRRRPTLAWMGGLLILVTTVGMLGVISQWRRAEARSEDTRQQLLRVHVLNAHQRLSEGDPLAALPWLAAALGDEPVGSERAVVYQTALGLTAAQCPLPQQSWWLPGGGTYARIAATGQRILMGNQLGWCRLVDRLGSKDIWNPIRLPSAIPSLAYHPDASLVALGQAQQCLLMTTATGAQESWSLPISGTVRHVTFSRDGRWLAAVTERSFRIWDAASRQPESPEIRLSGGREGEFSADSSQFHTTDHGGDLRVWSVPQAEPIRTLKLGSPSRLSIEPEGRWLLVTRDVERDALVLQPQSLEIQARLRHGAGIVAASFSADLERAATAGDDGRLRIWSIPGGISVVRPIATDSVCTTLAFSPDSSRVAVGTVDGRVGVWSAATGVPSGPWLRHAGRVRSLEFTPDGSQLLVASEDGLVRLWPVDSPQLPVTPLEGRTEAVWRVVQVGDPRGAIAAGPRSMIRFDSESGKARSPAMVHGAPVDKIAVSLPDGRVLSSCRDGQLRLWSGQGTLEATWPSHGDVSELSWLPSGEGFATLNRDGSVRLWPPQPPTGFTNQTKILRRPGGEGRRLGISPDGSWLAAGFDDHVVRSWSSDGTARGDWNVGGDVRALGISPDNRHAAVGTGNGWLVWCRITPVPQTQGRVAVEGSIQELRFSPSGDQLAVAVSDGTIRVYSRTRGSWETPPEVTVLRTTGETLSVQWSPDGKLLLSWGPRVAQLWHAGAGVALTGPLRQNRDLAGAGFSADGLAVSLITEDARVHRLTLPGSPSQDVDWRMYTQLLSSRRVDGSGDLVPWWPLGDTSGMPEALKWEQRWHQLQARAVSTRGRAEFKSETP